MSGYPSTSNNSALRIAFVHHKGGTGKTTACLNIAGWLTKMHQKVLVVDLDPQANATTGLGVALDSLQHSMYDVLLDQNPIQQIVLETRSGVMLAPASVDLLSAELADSAVDSLRINLSEIDHFFHYILIDCPPGSSLLMMNGMLAAQNIIIPLDAGIFGFETLETLKTLILQLENEFDVKINVLMAILKVFSPSLLDKMFTKKIRQMITEFFLNHGLKDCLIQSVPLSTKICEAQVQGLPISHFAPNSKVGKVYKKIAADIMQWGNRFN